MDKPKIYYLKKDINHPMGSVKAGTASVVSQGYYVFEYEGRYFNQDENGWLGNGFLTSSCDDEEWYSETPITKDTWREDEGDRSFNAQKFFHSPK